MSYQTPTQKRLRRKFRMTPSGLMQLQATDPDRANAITSAASKAQRPTENPEHPRHARRVMGMTRRQYRKDAGNAYETAQREFFR